MIRFIHKQGEPQGVSPRAVRELTHPGSPKWRHRRPRGFSQFEVAMSALIAGVILTAALNLTGSASRGQVQNNDQLRARLIANNLMAEVLELPFEDPSQTPVFGPESGETMSPARRTQFDDVDDYHNWSSAPQTKSGSAIQDSQGLITTVQVKLADPGQLGAGATGSASAEVKQITVAVKRGTYVVSESVSVVTK
jgi:hypothetical protein